MQHIQYQGFPPVTDVESNENLAETVLHLSPRKIKEQKISKYLINIFLLKGKYVKE